MVPWIDLIRDPGEGNLNLRAIVASLLGPRRIAHGRRRVVQVPPVQATQIAQNKAKNQQALYVEVWLPNQLLGVGARILFSSSDSTGETAVLRLFATEEDRYQVVLLPQEQLYAQAVSDAAGNAAGPRTPLVVSAVAF